jgi:hypothetical protein
MVERDRAEFSEVLAAPVLIEQLAVAEHERWSHWQRYMHEQCREEPDGSLVIPADLVRRWDRQMRSSYADLSESEKQSDREQVLRYLPIIATALQRST